MTFLDKRTELYCKICRKESNAESAILYNNIIW